MISLGALFFFFHELRLASAAVCNVLATLVATLPSYYLNRTWAWGKTGRSHLVREVIPFWVAAFASLVASTVAVGAAAHVARHFTASNDVITAVVECANFCTYGLLWVGKFVLFNKVLFVVPDSRTARGEALASAEVLDAP